MTNTDTRGSRGSNTLAYVNEPPGCNARTLLQKGQPVRRKTAIGLKRTRGFGEQSY